HGWTSSVSGAWADTPSEPAESNFKPTIPAPAYSCAQRGGLVWAYMGPPASGGPPPLPDLEALNLRDGQPEVGAIQRECNWLQALEGDIDTSHFSFLHFGAHGPETAQPGTFQYYTLKDRAPRYSVLDT